MIKIINGDLLQAKEDIIAHQVNCQGVMGSGVAKQIREKFPDAYSDYKTMVDYHKKAEGGTKELLGKVQAVKINSKWICNIFGQHAYGHDGKLYTSTDSLYEAFKTIRTYAERVGLSVALPYMIGCYRGGADWKLVEDLLLKAFDGYEVTLYKKDLN